MTRLRLRSALALLTAPALAGPLAAQDPAAIEHALRFTVRAAGRPDTAMELLDRMTSWHVPGVSIAIIDNWRVVYARGFGVQEFGARRPVDSTTLFLAGSISKPVFSSALLRFVEQRKLSLDADVTGMLTSWRLAPSPFTATEKVTLRRLLTHTAGLTVWGFPGYEMGAPIPTVPQVLGGVEPANTPKVGNDTTPGARWLYSGGGFTIAQLVATDLSGESFPALMNKLMLRPAGMTRSTYENPLPMPRWSEAATGHEKLDTPVPGHFHVYPEMAAAGLWTTAADLGRWAIALARSVRGEPGGILSPAMAREMVRKQVQQKPPFGTRYWGLGVAVAGDGDSLVFSHGGRDEGFVADLAMWPNKGRGIVILTNGVAPQIFGEIRRAFAEQYGVGGDARPEKAVVVVPEARLAAYAGKFVAVEGKDTIVFDISVAPGGAQLAVLRPELRRSLPFAPLGSDRFVNLESGVEWTFEREASGVQGRPMSLFTMVGPRKRQLTRQ
ncbi:MAG: beta-lactamase family protein [Gemmatimonadetes bacterium]|nr:beta-lactamase family protein [Gemmatimonadota bacterium]